MRVADRGDRRSAHHLDIGNMLASHAANADYAVTKFAFHSHRLDHLGIFGQGGRRNTLIYPRLLQEVRPLPPLCEKGKSDMAITPPQYLLHHDGDNVAVAMADMQPGTLHAVSYTHLTLPTNREV